MPYYKILVDFGHHGKGKTKNHDGCGCVYARGVNLLEACVAAAETPGVKHCNVIPLSTTEISEKEFVFNRMLNRQQYHYVRIIEFKPLSYLASLINSIIAEHKLTGEPISGAANSLMSFYSGYKGAEIAGDKSKIKHFSNQYLHWAEKNYAAFDVLFISFIR